MKPEFRLTDKQQQILLACWKRPVDKKYASAFIDDAQKIIAKWLRDNYQFPPTSIRGQISLASDIQTKVRDLLNALENLPKDVTGMLGVIWLRERYGDAYFEQHTEACRKDQESNAALRIALEAAMHGFAPEGTTKRESIQSELSKLPPDFSSATKETISYLSTLSKAAGSMANMLRDAKQWHNKDAEKDLLLSLAMSYAHHFRKPPSAANARAEQPESASSFRKFLSALEPMIGQTFGCPLIREVVKTVRSYVEIPIKN